MAIHTKFGDKIINDSLRVDNNCIFDSDIVKVWATIEGEAQEKQYWLSDLIADKKREVRDVLAANSKQRQKNAQMTDDWR
jgi:hypothetical protein